MRDTVICFRTREDTRKVLEKISKMDGRSLSSVIENILYDYVERRELKKVTEEKRRCPRKKVSAPALVTSHSEVSISPSPTTFNKNCGRNPLYPSYSPCLEAKSLSPCSAHPGMSVPAAR